MEDRITSMVHISMTTISIIYHVVQPWNSSKTSLVASRRWTGFQGVCIIRDRTRYVTNATLSAHVFLLSLRMFFIIANKIQDQRYYDMKEIYFQAGWPNSFSIPRLHQLIEDLDKQEEEFKNRTEPLQKIANILAERQQVEEYKTIYIPRFEAEIAELELQVSLPGRIPEGSSQRISHENWRTRDKGWKLC